MDVSALDLVMRSEDQRRVWFGLMTLLLSVLPSAFFLLAVPNSYSFAASGIPERVGNETPVVPLSLSIPLATDFSSLSVGNARGILSFSVDPPRPDAEIIAKRLMIRLLQSKQVKRVELPAKVDLEFFDGFLQFSEKPSQFWLVCSLASEQEVAASLMYQTPEGKDVLSSEWTSPLQETPIQSAEEFPTGTPFRQLGESRWLGPDLFLEKYGGGALVHRIEMGSDLIDCSFKDWLVFKEGKWCKIKDLKEAEDLPIAHLKASLGGLEIEGWEGSSHIRMKTAPSSQTPLKMKGEDLFAQLRVRSEKQISCMLDKQCLILRPNDWILKGQGRWKILRKKEEREAFLDGKISGEIFVLDRIEAKGTTKNISGHYFSAGRSQMVPIEYAQKPSQQKGVLKK